MPGSVPGAGDTLQRSETDTVWALGWLPGRTREMKECLAANWKEHLGCWEH